MFRLLVCVPGSGQDCHRFPPFAINFFQTIYLQNSHRNRKSRSHFQLQLLAQHQKFPIHPLQPKQQTHLRHWKILLVSLIILLNFLSLCRSTRSNIHNEIIIRPQSRSKLVQYEHRKQSSVNIKHDASNGSSVSCASITMYRTPPQIVNCLG